MNGKSSGLNGGCEVDPGVRLPRMASLDELATSLMQLEPADGEELAELRHALEELAFEGGLPIPAQARIAGAARRIAEACAAASEEAGREALRQAGDLIGQAMQEVDATRTIAPDREVLAPAEIRSDTATLAPEPLWELSVEEDDSSLLADFITESREYMESAEAALLELETQPDEMEAINTIFRAFHTIKGTSAFLGLGPVSELAHHSESLFNRFRDGELRCTGIRADISLRSVDLLKELLTLTEQAMGGSKPVPLPDEYGALLHILADLEGSGLLEDDPLPAGAAALPSPRPEGVPDAPAPEPAAGSEAEASARALDHPTTPASRLPASAPTPESIPARTPADAPRARGQRGEGEASESVRVRTDRLDQLIDMVGELVIAQSMVAQDEGVLQDASGSELGRKIARAGKIVRELQDLSVALRMVPLRATFQKMNRLVRDVARKSGKEVDFVLSGEETEVDRTLVDLIGDPLVHMIRNAIDHGIEPPGIREARGKERAGRISLSAYHAGGNVVVELSDDGRGLDREGIVRKAVANGIIGPEQALSDAHVHELIFAPGFSTAEAVTDLSGRGVGMDVVRRSIESLSGRIEIHSEPGRGSTFTIRLPLTLAVTDGMLVSVAGERYILPITNIQMSFRPTRAMLSTVAGRGEIVLLRGEPLRVVRLHQLFEISGAVHDPVEALLVIVGFGQQRCALLVDELLGQQQVVAKPVGQGVGRVPGISGGAILGDGQVGLILDVSEIVALATRAPLRARERAN